MALGRGTGGARPLAEGTVHPNNPERPFQLEATFARGLPAWTQPPLSGMRPERPLAFWVLLESLQEEPLAAAEVQTPFSRWWLITGFVLQVLLFSAAEYNL